jgi:hypothetical protein
VEKLKSKKGAHDDVDALFQLPLTEFTAARNALAGRLKKAGDAAEADRIKAIGKPSVPAWAVNQLFWKHRIAFDRLLDAGERFRKAQTAQLAGKSTDLRAPLEERRTALSELSAHAARLLAEAGNTGAPDTMRRITTTLEALSTYAGIPDTPQPGRLVDDVQPPGFEALAALVPQTGKSERGAGPTRIIPFESKQPARKHPGKNGGDEKARAAERKAEIAAAREIVQNAEGTLRDARKTAQRAEEELKKAAALAKEADAEKQKAEQQLEQAAARADDARKKARTVAASAEAAAQEVEDAERALEKARRALSAMNEE